MQKNRSAPGLSLLTSALRLAGCKDAATDQRTVGGQNEETFASEKNTENLESALLTSEIRKLGNGLSAGKSAVRHEYWIFAGILRLRRDFHKVQRAEKRLAHVQFNVRYKIMLDRNMGKKPLILAGEAAV